MPSDWKGFTNQQIKQITRPKPEVDKAAQAKSQERRMEKQGLRHEPYDLTPAHFATRKLHPSRPVWWERTKGEDGKWTATPHYGKAININGKRVQSAQA